MLATPFLTSDLRLVQDSEWLRVWGPACFTFTKNLQLRTKRKNLKFQSFSGGFDQVSVLTVILTAVCLPSANLRFYVKTLNLGKILRLSMKNYDSFSPLELWTTILLPPPLPLSSAGLSVARRDARKLMYLPSDVM